MENSGQELATQQAATNLEEFDHETKLIEEETLRKGYNCYFFKIWSEFLVDVIPRENKIKPITLKFKNQAYHDN